MTPTLSSSATAQQDAVADTREILLMSAMRLFAEHGFDRISLQTISIAAGNRNKSAVGYHFANKQGLIDAVLYRLARDLEPATDSRISVFEAALAHGERLTLDEVVLGLLEPVLLLYGTTDYGRDAIKVLARMMHDPTDNIPTALRMSCIQLIERAISVLHRTVPDKPLIEMEHHVHHVIMATVNGLAMQKWFIERGASRWSREPLPDLFLSYASFVAAGLAGRPSSLDPAIAAAWKKRMINNHT